MKSLYDVCKPRISVFDESKRDDTLDLSNLLDGSINGEEFFEETQNILSIFVLKAGLSFNGRVAGIPKVFLMPLFGIWEVLFGSSHIRDSPIFDVI